MLLQRIITALILLPLLLAVVWFAPNTVLYAVLCVIGVLVAWEWAALWGAASPQRRLRYAAASGALLLIAWLLPARAVWLPWLLALAALWWLAALALLPGFPDNLRRRPLPPLFMALLGWLLLLSTLLSFAVLHALPQGPLKLLYVFFLVFAADTGAYLAGRTLGRHKLAPNVSPGKTVEGAAGGLLLAGVWAATGGVQVFGLAGADALWLVLLSVVVAAFSIVGDLTESMFKRVAGIKDSGTLLPGHGGLLDRADSLLAAAPLMLLGLMLLGLS
jgi:phosphatidate cytidylyltransferase